MIKKIVMSILAILMTQTLFGCGINTIVSKKDERVNFEKIGITEEYYNDTKDLIDKYSSDEIKDRISKIYADFGGKTYDSNVVQRNKEQLESEVKSDYYNIFKDCKNEPDKEMVLFGYNYTLLNLMNQEFKEMGVKSINYSEDLEKYYNQFCKINDVNMFDDFRLIISKGNIMDYANSIVKKSIDDVAEILSLSKTLFDANIYLENAYLEERDMVSLYDTHKAAMEIIDDIIDTLEDYPEYKKKFTKVDLDSIQTAAAESTKYCKALCDAYSKGDMSAVTTNATYMIEYLKVINEFLTDLDKHIDKILN
ncbi:hypothetical protein GPL15_06825 [Clostridium sp. MCC353]|uniref:hypothetical protein n=1 Tax=Clostridium sp. MCC353 TaxID=2592646 RepID=UPI001C016E12|nr:hypothetical protein [Clostridium sp. MCC353]MBT9776215.1 hypothetical protein [Clostridium sp. MCC353]